MISADCWKCAEEQSDRLAAEGKWIESMNFGMYTCPQCGNKRCPKATDHDLDCTGSNESGQPGSRYTMIPSVTPEERKQKLDEYMAELKEDLKRL